MPLVRETLLGLFTEIAILEHLARTRVDRKFPDGMSAHHFGILNYFIRNHPGPDSVAGIAWSFQEEESYTLDAVRTLNQMGYVSVVNGLDDRDTMVDVTDAGRKAAADQLEKMGPEFMSLVGEIPWEDLETAHRVLHDIRLVMDNLPDR